MNQPPVLDPTPPTPHWFRDPFRWLVITPPLIAVVAGGLTMWLAIRSYDGLVVDDYYKQGLEINQVLARDERATALALHADVEWIVSSPTEGRVVVHWDGGAAALAPATLDLKLIYATRAGFDRDVQAERVAPDRYEVTLPALRQGEWHVHIASADWRLTESFVAP